VARILSKRHGANKLSVCPESKGKGKERVAFSQLDDSTRVVVFRDKTGAKVFSQPSNLINVKIVDEFSNKFRRRILARRDAVSGQFGENRFFVLE
jgi:hypothetical protein